MAQLQSSTNSTHTYTHSLSGSPPPQTLTQSTQDTQGQHHTSHIWLHMLDVTCLSHTQVLTGDNLAVTLHVAGQIGLPVSQYVTGPEIEAASDEEVMQLALQVRAAGCAAVLYCTGCIRMCCAAQTLKCRILERPGLQGYQQATLRAGCAAALCPACGMLCSAA